MDRGGTERPHLGHRPALDGVRGIAILLVIGCHCAIPHLEIAGQVGVTVFFVLSGFLITSQLLDQDRVHFGQFWMRRARRLLPALIVMIVTLFPVFVLAGWSARGYVRDAIPGLFYFANFYEYRHGWTMPFGHLWSLSVEEQFYVVFPIVVALLRNRPRAILVFSIVGGGVSAVARYWCSRNPATEMRGYFGMDTNAFALLLGAALAALFVMGARPGRWQLAALVVGAVTVGLPATGHFIGSWSAAALPAALGSGFLIVASLGDRRLRILEWAPLRFCGKVSYGWYLWQGPLLALTWSTLTPGHMVEKIFVCLGALGVATLSWHFIERPVSRAIRIPGPARPRVDEAVG